jgi:hypothetical protein
MPNTNSAIFEESDFYDLLTGVCNYDLLCKKAKREDLLNKDDLIEKLRTRKV